MFPTPDVFPIWCPYNSHRFLALACGILLWLDAGQHLRGDDSSVARQTGTVITPAQPETWQPDSEARPWKYIVLHHSATSQGSVDGIHKVHARRRDSEGNFWRGIGYHFVIGNGNGMPDGQIEATFRWRDQLAGAHAGQTLFNEYGIGICLIGNFENSQPTNKQLDSLRQLIRVLSQTCDIEAEAVMPHGEIKATRCPGTRFPVKRFTTFKVQRKLPVDHSSETIQVQR